MMKFDSRRSLRDRDCAALENPLIGNLLGIGLLVAGIGGIASSAIGASSASDAANAQVQAANTASQTQLQMFDQTQANEAPYMGAGNNALQALMYGLGLNGPTGAGGATAGGGYSPYGGIAAGGYNPYAGGGGGYGGVNLAALLGGGAATGATGAAAKPGGANIGFGQLTQPFNYTVSPGYNYEVQQAMNAVQNGAAASGGLVSGNALRALQTNAQGLASTDYYQGANLDLAQKQSLYNMLQTLAGSGQNAAAKLGSLGGNTADSISAAQLMAGNANSAMYTAEGQNVSNLFNNQSFLNGIQGLFGGYGGTGGFGGGFDNIPGGGDF